MGLGGKEEWVSGLLSLVPFLIGESVPAGLDGPPYLLFESQLISIWPLLRAILEPYPAPASQAPTKMNEAVHG
jgi:hypothetical protein